MIYGIYGYNATQQAFFLTMFVFHFPDQIWAWCWNIVSHSLKHEDITLSHQFAFVCIKKGLVEGNYIHSQSIWDGFHFSCETAPCGKV